MFDLSGLLNPANSRGVGENSCAFEKKKIYGEAAAQLPQLGDVTATSSAPAALNSVPRAMSGC